MGLQLKGVFGSTYLRVTIEISQKSRQTDCDQRAMSGWKRTRAGVSQNAASEALSLNAVARSCVAEPNMPLISRAMRAKTARQRQVIKSVARCCSFSWRCCYMSGATTVASNGDAKTQHTPWPTLANMVMSIWKQGGERC